MHACPNPAKALKTACNPSNGEKSFCTMHITHSISALSLVVCLLPLCLAQRPLNASCLKIRTATRALSPSDVTATVLSEDSPISEDLFGSVGPTPAPASAFAAGVHPRIMLDADEWEALLSRYADSAHFDVPGTWSRYHRLYTLKKGPESAFITSLVALQLDGTANLYTGGDKDLSTLNDAERASLLPLAEHILTINEEKSGAFFMCAFWASVSRKRVEMYGESERFLPADIIDTCISATVVWAKIVLAHRAYHCNPTCTSSSAGRAYLWDFNKKWEVSNDWYTATSGLGFVYDFLYADMDDSQKKVIRSALALLIMKRWSWGNSVTSDRNSPNAVDHPHRIFSNWAIYHSNLYIGNLAIEGDTGFDVYSQSVLSSESESGFNKGLNTRFTAMIKAYLAHSIYPDGSTYEDGYSYFIAFREGALAAVAAHRRGVATIDTARFRNFIHNAAQMYEPWQCGSIIGHASGGGESYPAHIGLFRYAYPDGALPNMMWKHRMHPSFTDNAPCRIQWHQNMVQMTLFGGEHSVEAQSMQGMDAPLKKLIPKSFYATRRGLLIARNSLDDDSILLHFDARPDAFFPGHDNADRGVFTFSAFKKTWIGDLPWRENIDSRRHSLMHIDGKAQDEKAPSVKMMKVLDDGAVVLASADLTYAYNVQWARPWPGSSPPTTYIVEYNSDGTSSRIPTTFTIPEMGDPRDFGWPAGDDGADLGFARSTSNMHGDPDMGFMGMYTWKRDYRVTLLLWAVRSAVLVRSSTSPGYVVIADSFKMSGSAGNHVFESYLIFEKNVDIVEASSSCTGNSCHIVLSSTIVPETVDVHVLTLGSKLSFRTESIDTGYKRLVIKSEGRQDEEFIIALNAHAGDANGFGMQRLASGAVEVKYGSEERLFEFSTDTHDLEVAKAKSGPSAPMAARKLPFKTDVLVTTAEMSSDKEEYLHASTAAYQVVFKFVSRTAVGGERGDVLKTCYKTETTAETGMFLYDCEEGEVAEERYARRECSLVGQSTGADVCRKFMTRFGVRLRRNRPYFVAVDVKQRGTVVPRFKIRHSRGRVEQSD